MRSLESALDDLKEIKREVADLVRGWGSGDAPVLELLRRLAIGVVVCTFMFGVLRYVAGVYARYYDEARRGEDEYLQIRKLVAAYRAAASASESQKALLGAFLGGDGDPPVAAKPDEALTNEAAGLIKEILGNLARKI